ncbi:MAG: response regulator [Rhodocyclaceae bacterium]
MNPSQENILVVEDDDIVHHILVSALQKAGWGTVSARSGEEAIAILEHQDTSVRLVLIDLGLPGMSGLDLALWLATQRHIPFVVLTAYDSDEQIAAAIARGALSYLIKPVDTTQLVPVIRSALARYDDLDRLTRSTSQLETALQANRALSVAIGIRMHSQGVSEREAFEAIREEARARRIQMADIAQEIIKETSEHRR